MKNKAGFTLIEIMVSLVLVGLIAGVAGSSVLMGMRGYLFARENNAISQKAQLALGRLNREFIELSNVRDASGTCVVYESPYGRRAVALIGDTVRLFSDYANTTCPTTGGDTLVDGVQSFSILYNPSSGVSLWSMGQAVRNLFLVNIQLVLTRPDTGGTVAFYSTVSPRNNNNSGGAALPTTVNPPPEYSGRQCFVTTAAFGDADHHVVEVLRQFRDRFLMQAAPGQALVRLYYELGPSLAAAIEGRPIACLLVRLLVTPVAGFAFLVLTCPLLIPLILLLSWGLARLAVRAMQQGSIRWLPRVQRQRGAMLVTLLAAMVVFSALGAVMVAMFGTAALSQTSGSSTQRAYYMAESGFRHAASAYLNVTGANELTRETARDNLLENELHGKTFSLASGDGGFQIDVYPYYYKVVEAPVTTSNVLRTRVTGGFPFQSPVSYNDGSWIQITKTDGTTLYVQIAGASLHVHMGFNEVRFYKKSGNWDSAEATIDLNSAVTPVCKAHASTPIQTRVEEGVTKYDMAFQWQTGAGVFPEKNGVVLVTDQATSTQKILGYKTLKLSDNKLIDVYDPNGMYVPNVQPGSNIVLAKFIRLESTGIFGTGTAAVSRMVQYFIPIGYAKAQPEPKSQFHDTMADLSKWQTGDHISRIGTPSPGTSYGSTIRAGARSTYTLPGGSCLNFREFQVGLNWSAAGLPVPLEWSRAGNYLSYDLEAKAFQTLMSPSARYAVGVTFRLDESGNAMGFTFARGVPGYTSGCDNDGIPSGIFGFLSNIPGYENYKPVLLVWTKEYARKESGIQVVTSPCSATPPATIDEPPQCGRAAYAFFSYRTDWQNGDRVRFTNTGGALPPPIIAGRDYYIRKIVYQSDTYLYLFSSEVGALGSPFDPLWPGLQDIGDYGSGMTTVIAQSPSFTKLAHQVLASGNENYNLIFQSVYMKAWATFAARVLEAPSVSFVSGGGTAGREILSGETVYQTANNLPGGTITAIYRVMRSPVYRAAESGTRRWSSGTEQGVLLLERIAGEPLSDPSTAPFTAGSKIFVGEHPGGTDAGTVGLPGGVTDTVFRVRDNWLLLYVGDPNGKAPADTDPFNNYRSPVLRGSVLWPPDSAEDTVVNNDNFTLLRFSDYVNPSLSCKVNGVDRSGSECLGGFFTKNNTGPGTDVLRFASPDGTLFYTPQSGSVFPTGRAEFGLHAYGSEGNGIEFDDFGVQFGPGYGITRKGFLLPIQQ